ncbi:MAG TPA: hypothetical protein VGJ73_00890 [Verrucomicrobiae bacterium]|jgi:hypothetical protein
MKNKVSVSFIATLSIVLFLAVGCASDRLQQEVTQVTKTSDAANNWLRVQVDPSLTPDIAWQKLMDSVTGYYPDLEMIDVPSGYIRSVHTTRQFGQPGSKSSFQVRTRFVCTIASKSPLVYKIKIESEEAGPPYLDWTPFNRVFNQDEQVIEELQSRLGVK